METRLFFQLNLKIIAALLVALFLSLPSYSYETDQYTTPEQPIADIGEDLSNYIYQNLNDGLMEINQYRKTIDQDISNLEFEVKAFGDLSLSGTSEDTVTEQVYKQTLVKLNDLKRLKKQISSQSGVIEYLFQRYSGSITWNDQRDGVFGLGLSYVNYPKDLKDGKNLNFNPSKFNTVYSYSGFHRLISPSYFVFASTINAYGVNMGVDKFGHFVNQGYEYFILYNQFLKSGDANQKALSKVVQWGIDTEDGLFGSLVDGVYSNGDLAANFSGFMFYENFFSEFTIEGKVFPKIINIEADGSFSMNRVEQNKPENILKRFISDHLDESINASVLERPQRSIVRQAIKNRCERWLQVHKNLAKSEMREIETSTLNWHGYDYGKKTENALLISDICYEQ